MWQLLLDMLFPRSSIGGRPGAWITEEELRALQAQARPLRLNRGQLQARGIRHLDAVVAAGEYDAVPLLKTALLTFKYRGIRTLAGPLGTLLVRAAPLLVAPMETVLCPVPLHRWRLRSRGFNQSLLLAEAVSAARGWPVAALLRRRRQTGHQARRHREERLRAMADAFAPAPGLSAVPSHVVLVDDVCTTGATLDACAATLRAMGVAHVSALVVAWG